MKKGLPVLSILLLCFTRLFAQVDLQTGSATYAIPVYNYSDARSSLAQNVSVRYSSGQGIKVNQVASNIGLGWNIQTGGEIIRIQHGAPDDQYNPEPDVINMTEQSATNLIFNQTNPGLYAKYYPNGFLYKAYDIDYWPKQLAFQPRFGSGESAGFKMAPKAGEDTEQDEFMVNLNGSSRTFVIGRNFEVRYEDGCLAKTEIIKEETNDHTLYSQGILTKIKGFIITDEQGILYTFNRYELDELFEFNLIPYVRLQQPIGKYVVNRWVLTSIKDPVANREIVFDHVQEDWKYVTDISYSSTNVKKNGVPSGSKTTSVGVAHTKVWVLHAITCPGNISVLFNYNSVKRRDLSGSASLQSIEVTSQGVLLKRVVFDLAYFLGKEMVSAEGMPPLVFESMFTNTYYTDLPLIRDAYRYRLALRKVEFWNGAETEHQDYTFDYYRGQETTDPADQVVSRLSLNRDRTGFYYRASDLSALVFDINGYPINPGMSSHNPDLPDAKFGLMKSAASTQGNTLTYEYKGYELATRVRYAVLVDKTTIQETVAGASYAKKYTYPTTASGNLVSTVYNTENWNATLGMAEEFGLTYLNDGSRNMPGNWGSMLTSSFIEATMTGAVMSGTAAQIGGLFLQTFAGKVAMYFMGNIIADLFESLFGSGDDETVLDIYSYSNIPLREYNPFPSLLASVVEHDIIDGTAYMARRYNFSTITSGLAYYGAPWSSRQLTEPGKYGNLVQVLNYDRAGNVVSENNMTYTFSTTVLDNNFRSVKYGPVHYYSAPYTHTPFSDGGIANNWILSDAYNYRTGYCFLSEESEKQYQVAEQTSTTVKNYYKYNPANRQVQQSYLVNSDGKVTGRNACYAINLWDVHIGDAVMQKLKLHNRVNTVTAEIVWYKNAVTDPVYYVTAIRTINYDLATLKPATASAYRIEIPLAVSEADLDNFDVLQLPAWLATIPSDLVQQNTYTGNLLTETRVNDQYKINAIKYDDLSGLPVANIINATGADVSYTSFESEAKDGWLYENENVLSYPVTAIVGTKTYQVAEEHAVSRQGLNSNTAYQVTLWANNNSIRVNGVAGTELFATGVWHLYRFVMQNVTAVTITGDAAIDELRLLPAQARMQTVCYDPVLGIKVAAADVNNRIVYYEYDTWQRLLLIRDENRNIVKRYCYNFEGQPGDCAEGLQVVDRKCEHVYAKIFYENQVNTGTNTKADIVVRFYADAEYTIPCQARDLVVNYSLRNECGLQVIGIGGGTSRQKKVSGWYATLEKSVIIGKVLPNPCPTPPCLVLFCDVIYILEEGQGYTPFRHLFGNYEKSAVFTRNNCPVGSIPPPPYNYVVPASKYTSYYSQKHADEQASDEITLQGQAKANTEGDCIEMVYVKLVYETATFGSNIVIYFYSDNACTQPVTITNRTINYRSNGNCLTTQNKQATVSGSSAILEQNVQLSYPNLNHCSTCPLYCFINYSLLAGTGYTIVP